MRRKKLNSMFGIWRLDAWANQHSLTPPLNPVYPVQRVNLGLPSKRSFLQPTDFHHIALENVAEVDVELELNVSSCN